MPTGLRYYIRMPIETDIQPPEEVERSLPPPVTAPATRHRAKRGAKRRGRPPLYPWDSLEVGQIYYIPAGRGVQFDSVCHAVYRKNRVNKEIGRPERYRVPNSMGKHPEKPDLWVWALQRYA